VCVVMPQGEGFCTASACCVDDGCVLSCHRGGGCALRVRWHRITHFRPILTLSLTGGMKWDKRHRQKSAAGS